VRSQIGQPESECFRAVAVCRARGESKDGGREARVESKQSERFYSMIRDYKVSIQNFAILVEIEKLSKEAQAPTRIYR